MGTREVGAPYNAGTHFTLRQRFGAFPVAPLLRALTNDLEPGSVIKFVTVTDPTLRAFLKAQGHLVWRFPWRHDAELRLSQGPASLEGLVALAERHQATGLAVWFLVHDVEGKLLLESEDGNNYLWLADRLPHTTREHLLAAVGGALHQIDNVAATF
jgi:hypothetical protein